MRRRTLGAAGVLAAALAVTVLVGPVAPAQAGTQPVVVGPSAVKDCTSVTLSGDLDWTVRRGLLVARWSGRTVTGTSVRLDVDAACAEAAGFHAVVGAVGRGPQAVAEQRDGQGGFAFGDGWSTGFGGISWEETAPADLVSGWVSARDVDLGSARTRPEGGWCAPVVVVVERARTQPDGIVVPERVDHHLEVCSSR
ncbi:hypothetical protein [Cellulomonas xiejunii]|uniref:Uncharacterized protein n=1 Tax=Cellulomonas xiejunii TaxID=2968083 RepID=A0ABY5KNI9_9CELL|nr:hypothetical protein [Cellulomonas xiejunii]MCC2320345.1 hypothetical protein [Cellulomonas xiejunii]UUI70645.1 hypothetical protein NP048_12670 [Cellulomonas xiejunii]